SKLQVPPKAVWWYNKQQEMIKGNKSEPYSMYNRIQFMTAKWDSSTPEEFVFSSKVPGMITHAKMLRDCATETRLFLKAMQGVKKMKYLLYEFPSYFTKKDFFWDLKEYFSKMPDTYRYVAEFRSADWQTEEVEEYLDKKGIIHALSEVQNKGVTTLKESDREFLYVRLIGKHSVFKTFERAILTDTTILNEWAEKIRNAKDSIVFVNNNFAGNAPETANCLKKLVGLEPKEWKEDLKKYF
ncbi:MAG: DUF72 domain-containing protein, partial [Candidatus Woesearchaeota archaeon]